MPQINIIELHLSTGSLSGAGTDGDVYLGLCGREFSIDSTSDDFEGGSGRTYVLGEGANIRNAGLNDPRTQQLFTENVSNFPVYIRFQPRSRNDHWQLQRADVRFNGSFTSTGTLCLSSSTPRRRGSGWVSGPACLFIWRM